eukprot:TRINITY_DN3243_c0_g2_i1.p1 TRINITY_DN3243_c0_g2~~TRINITY_DN3243_c0_g2_i1.p1  ORF type:complete len:164 (-),score=35.32 TRINITY_DN3243_c0_g2_i1:243-713(-)
MSHPIDKGPLIEEVSGSDEETQTPTNTIPTDHQSDDEEITEVWSPQQIQQGEHDATHFKTEGNKAFGDGFYDQAIDCYTQALECLPKDHSMRAIILGNRAAAFIKLEDWDNGLEDCNGSLKIDPDYVKVLNRRAIVSEALENYSQAKAGMVLVCWD